MNKPLIVLLFLAGCSGAPAAGDSELAAQQPIELRFEWPVGIDGTFNKFGTTTNDDRRTSIDMTWSIATEPADAGWLLRYGEVRDLEITGLPPQQKEMVAPVVKTLPSVRFRGNKVEDIVDFEPMVERLHEMMAPMYEENPALETQIRASMTPETFLDSARAEWSWRATDWHGHTMRVGESVERDGELTLELLPGVSRATDKMTLDEVLPCPNAAERRCVRLTRRVEIAEEDLREALAKPLAGAQIDNVERYAEFELVAEPDTLLTYQFRQVEVVRLEGEGVNRVDQRKVTRELYEWNRSSSHVED